MQIPFPGKRVVFANGNTKRMAAEPHRGKFEDLRVLIRERDDSVVDGPIP